MGTTASHKKIGQCLCYFIIINFLQDSHESIPGECVLPASIDSTASTATRWQCWYVGVGPKVNKFEQVSSSDGPNVGGEGQVHGQG